MSAYNVVSNVRADCPHCHSSVVVGVQFKFGAVWQYVYAVGDPLRWGRNEIGRPGQARLVADGAADSACPVRGYTGDWDFYILIENDRIIEVTQADGTYDFISDGSSYLELDARAGS